MALTLQVLGTGVIAPAGNSYVYPPGGTTVAGKSALVKNIMLTNVGSAVATVEVKVRWTSDASNPRYCAPKNLQIPVNAQFVLDNEISLNVAAATPDAVNVAVTGASSSIEWVVNGLLRDV